MKRLICTCIACGLGIVTMIGCLALGQPRPDLPKSLDGWLRYADDVITRGAFEQSERDLEHILYSPQASAPASRYLAHMAARIIQQEGFRAGVNPKAKPKSYLGFLPRPAGLSAEAELVLAAIHLESVFDRPVIDDPKAKPYKILKGRDGSPIYCYRDVKKVETPAIKKNEGVLAKASPKTAYAILVKARLGLYRGSLTLAQAKAVYEKHAYTPGSAFLLAAIQHRSKKNPDMVAWTLQEAARQKQRHGGSAFWTAMMKRIVAQEPLKTGDPVV